MITVAEVGGVAVLVNLEGLVLVRKADTPLTTTTSQVDQYSFDGSIAECCDYLMEVLKPTGNPLVDKVRQIVDERKAARKALRDTEKAASEQPPAGEPQPPDANSAAGAQASQQAVPGLDVSPEMSARLSSAKQALSRSLHEGTEMPDFEQLAGECGWVILGRP